jgi:phosphatidylglycerol:prolipoprotein diacylglycerol transferase
MFPSFELFGRTIWMYQIMTLCGIFAAGIYSYRAAVCAKYNEADVVIFLLIAGIGVFLGGHILYAIVNYRKIIYTFQNAGSFNSINAVRDQVYLIFGGSVFYGGLLGGIAAARIFYGKKGKEFACVLDMVTPAFPLFHFFGRIGCFLAGCCFGIESSFGFTYSCSIVEEANGINRFPVQLLESFLNLLIFIILLKNRRNSKLEGRQFFLYLLIYSAVRFFLEFFRGDDYRGIWIFLSTSQWLSILLFFAATFTLLKAQLHPVVPPQVSHFIQVPLRTNVKNPQTGQGSPS